MLRTIVFSIYLLVGVSACIFSIKVIGYICMRIIPCVRCLYAKLKGTYHRRKDRMKKNRAVYPTVVITIPMAEVTIVDRIPYPASIVYTIPVEILPSPSQ